MAPLMYYGDRQALPLIIHLQSNMYRGKKDVGNLIRYITRTRPDENRRNELVAYGAGSGCPCIRTPEEMIDEFVYVISQYGTKGSLIVHYTIQISDYQFDQMDRSMDRLKDCMVECCQYIFNDLGHQCCFAIHYSKEHKLHAHIVINSTNYRTGHKLHQYYKSLIQEVEIPLRWIMSRYMIRQVPDFSCFD